MSKSKQLNPSWFWKILGFKGGSIEVSEKGVTLHKSDKSYFIDNHSFVKKSRVEENLIFYSLVFDTSEGEVRFGKLPQAKANEVFEWLQAHWYLEIFPEINKVFKRISKKFNQSYVRSSEWPEIEKDAKNALNRFVQIPEQGLIEKIKRNPFVGIHRYATMGLGGLEDYRKAYVNKKKSKFAEYFANIESNPLTDDQINACIIDEDNNLVLAGAGTGKTSTMIGRAGFLLEDAQAKPQDILMIAFAKKAAEEMQDRMKERINRDDVSISTFHKLGKDIIAKAENGSPSISKYAEDKQGVLKHDINIWITGLLEKKDYKDKVLEYFEDYLFIEEDPFSFDSEGEYLEYLEANEIRTFKGEKVKGHGERIIANHLFRMGIEYQYEEPYKYTTRTLDYGQYKPDFYLPEYGIYIEHFGTARDGSTAPYIDMDLYQQGMDWKRTLHENNNTQLVETFFYEHIEGNLKKVLNERLTEVGIKFKPLPDEAVLETLRESGDITAFASLVTDIIKLLKVNWFDQSKLDKKIKNSPYPKHLEVMLELVDPIMKTYQEELDASEEIDFEDMIGKALDYVETGRFKSTWKYIMVDEFQDISDSRARLVQALQRSSKKCSIFCVGDDWQAIYRFQASDISFTTGFDAFFGATKSTTLGKTFRFNNSICDVSSKFVKRNPNQTQKVISTLKKVEKPAVSILRQSKYIPVGEPTAVTRILEKISEKTDDASVLILSRFTHNLPEDARQLQALFSGLDIKFQTIHSSKGKEADYVITVGMETGKWGFPSEIIENPLKDALLPDADGFDASEERRLFYVAVTRAKLRTYLVVDMGDASKFIHELIDGDYEVELEEFEDTEWQRLQQILNCIKCQTGSLRARSGSHGRFYGCSHYPLCDHTEDGCNQCGLPMPRIDGSWKGGYRVCQKCKTWIPVCQKCGNDMVRRHNSQTKKPFWGCVKWTSKDPMSCSGTANCIAPPEGMLVDGGDREFDKSSQTQKDSNYVKSVSKSPQEALGVSSGEKIFYNFQEANEYASQLAMKGVKPTPRLEKIDNNTWKVK